MESQGNTNRLVDVNHALTARQGHILVSCVKAAYREGSSTQDLLAVIDISRYLRDVPTPLVRRAWQAVHDWAWIDARRRLQAPVPASRAPGTMVAFKAAHGHTLSMPIEQGQAGVP